MDEKRERVFLHHYAKCEHCDSTILLNLSDNMRKYGFICPECKKITPASRLWDSLIRYGNKKDLN